MLHPLELEPNPYHLVNCSRQQQQLWQKARSSQFFLAAHSSMQFREVKMQSEMCWQETLVLEEDSNNSNRAKGLHLAASRVEEDLEEVEETLVVE